MILIAGRLYRFENPKNYSLPNDVMAKIIPSSDGKLQLSITRATDIPQTITIQTDANPPKEFWNFALSPLDIKTPLDIKKLINDLGIDIWSLLLKGVVRDKKHISGDMTELLEGWIIKSKEKVLTISTPGISSCLYYWWTNMNLLKSLTLKIKWEKTPTSLS
jgi:hypothetical protein